jgi:uncharacterized protein YoxC
MNKQYVSPQLIQEEVRRMQSISEYHYFTDVSEEDDKKNDALTMDDFSAPPEGGGQGGPPPEQGAPPQGGAPQGGAQPPADGNPPADPFGGQDAPQGDATQEPPMDDATGDGGEPTEEIDVTDIVQDTKAVNQKTDDITAKVDQTLQQVNGMLEKINSLEQNVQKMDQAIGKIDAIYQQVELSKPPTPEEVKEVMAQNSYPFNVQLSQYGKEGTPRNQTEMEQGKGNKKLSLSGLLGDFNERDIRNSFNPPDPFEDKVARSLPAYRI